MSAVDAGPTEVPERIGSPATAAGPALPPAVPSSERLPVPGSSRRRGWLVRRMLLGADIVGLLLAFLAVDAVMAVRGSPVDFSFELLLFVTTLPLWVFMAKVYGLYDRDDERTDHSTVDDLVGVFHLATVGAWLLFAALWLTDLRPTPPLEKIFAFWALSIAAIGTSRAVARTLARRHPAYRQNTIIVGAGDVGQLVGRKLRQHAEYGVNLVGFVDAAPRDRRGELHDVPMLGAPDELPGLIEELGIERVVIAFSQEPHERTLELVRRLKDYDVQIDVVPRLYEIIGPSVGLHSVESLPLIGLPPARLSRSSRLVKRGLDVLGASILLVLLSPLFAFIAWRIKRSSPGPVFFRQERLGLNMQPFTVLKFRTMRVGTDDAVHRDFIKATMSAKAEPTGNGLYKLQRDDAITPFGRWLRRTSLDELPQMLNVLRGQMSLVGPRPCLEYETELFRPHHFERFLLPPGLTGLWQVTARAHSTFGEALDMDVAYVRGWSLGLDLWLVCRTPLQLFRANATS